MADAKRAKSSASGDAVSPGTHEVPGPSGETPGGVASGYLHLHRGNLGRPTVANRGLMEEARRFPALSEFLTCTEYEGRKREPASLILFIEAGWPKICLSDRDTSRVAFSTGESFLEALEALEENLEAGAVDWRQKKGYKPK